MNNIIKAIIILSVAANGFMGGLIAGHVVMQKGVCFCKDCDCRRERRDIGPFPTGWVVPDESPEVDPVPPKPKPKPGSLP